MLRGMANVLPHPSTVPAPESLFFQCKGLTPDGARDHLLRLVTEDSVTYEDAYKVFVAAFPDSPEAKEHAEKAA